MRSLKNVLLAIFMACATTTLVAGPVFAAEKKCDKAGKPCTKGKDCKKENCKPEKPEEPAPAPAPAPTPEQ